MCRQKDAKTVQGCALKTRSPCCAGYEFIFRLLPKNKSVLHADGLKKSLRRILSPLRWSAERRTTTPVPSSKEGDYGGRNEIFSNLRLARCKAADPWLWLAGLSVCRKREGVPLPRSGGGREGADASAIPYKHRLAHDPGGRRPSGRAFRCVGFLGRSPKSLLGTFGESKVPPRR